MKVKITNKLDNKDIRIVEDLYLINNLSILRNFEIIEGYLEIKELISYKNEYWSLKFKIGKDWIFDSRIERDNKKYKNKTIVKYLKNQCWIAINTDWSYIINNVYL